MLRNVARALLSKTLQSVLSRYLIDVDVEGLSFGEGWGLNADFRVSNVRLREGAVLFSLPAGRKIKRRKKRGGSGGRKGGAVEESAGGDDEMEGGVDDNGDDNEGSDSSEAKREDDNNNNSNDNNLDETLSDTAEAKNDETINTPNETNDTSRLDDASNSSRSSSMVTPPPYDLHRKQSSGLYQDVILSSSPSTISTVGPPPIGSSSKYWFCGSRGGNKTTYDSDDDDLDNDDGSDNDRRHGRDEDSVEDIVVGGEGGGVTTTGDEEVESEEVEEEIKREAEREEVKDEDELDIMVGTGGRIGSLHVRLVGKELFVSVENADLILEVRPKNTSPTAAKGTTDAATSKSKSPDPSKKKTDDTTKPTAAADSKTPKKSQDPKSTSEKVSDNKNILAKTIASLPHLLVKNCRIRIVFVEDDDDATLDDNVNDPRGIIVDLKIGLFSVSDIEDTDDDAKTPPTPSPDPPNGHHRSLSASNLTPLTTTPPAPSESYKRGSSLNALDHPKSLPTQPTVDISFLHRRISTGKGLSGGLSITIHPSHTLSSTTTPPSPTPPTPWARSQYHSQTHNHLLHLSAFDLITRIHLSTSYTRTITHHDQPTLWGDEYDEYTIDSMLFGLDYMAPVASIPMRDRYEEVVERVEGVEVERVQGGCCFNKVAGGGRRRSVSGVMPWVDGPGSWMRVGGGEASEVMEEGVPLPGTVLYLTIADPVEVNFDRESLEALGVINALLSPPSETTTVEDKTSSIPSTTESSLTNPGQTFPAYMTPENVYITGCHISAIIFRLHKMTPHQRYDSRYSFAYWECHANSITLDSHRLLSPRLSFDDVLVVCDEMKVVEYKGVMQTDVMTVGVGSEELRRVWPCTARELLHRHTDNPIVTNHSSPSHPRGALAARYFYCWGDDATLSSDPTVPQRQCMEMQLGDMMVEAPYDMINQFSTAVDEMFNALYPKVEDGGEGDVVVNETTTAAVPAATPPLICDYQLTVDGGEINLSPVIHFTFPQSQIKGRDSPRGGFGIETFLNNIQFQYGNSVKDDDDRPAPVPMHRLAALPEGVRMRILLHLDNLRPLEVALGVNKRLGVTNAFLRCHAINRRLGTMFESNRLGNGQWGVVEEEKGVSLRRRQEQQLQPQSAPREVRMGRTREVLLKRLEDLDDDVLEELLMLHRDKVNRE